MGRVVALVVLGVGFGALHRWVRGRWPGSRPAWRSDVAWFFLAPLLTEPLTRLVLAAPLLLAGAILGFGTDALGEGFGPLSALPVALQVGAMLLVADLCGYWLHRAAHTVPWLWRFHAVHHSSERLDWLAGVRDHPVNQVVQRAPIALSLLALGFRTDAWLAVAPILVLHGVLLHADLPWTFGPVGRWIASPRFHRTHHAADARANYAGMFPMWDRLFGTASFPAEEPTRFGVSEAIPTGFVGALVWPFRR